jgi:hypothetical protein
LSSTLGDHTETVVFEIPEAIGSSLDEFHLAVEAFGDPVVSRETPHACDRFDPIIEGVGEGLQGCRPVLPQEPNGGQQPVNVLLALFPALEFVVHEFAQLVQFLVECLEDRLGGEELVEL